MKKSTEKILMAAVMAAAVVFITVTAQTIMFTATSGEFTPFFIKKTETRGSMPKKIRKTSKGGYKELKKRFENIESHMGIPQITLEEAMLLYKKRKAVFVDARHPMEYKREHIKGAVSIPAGRVESALPAVEKKLKNKILITYCHGVGCRLSNKVAYGLYNKGYKKVGIFFGGWNQWKEHKYPTEAEK